MPGELLISELALPDNIKPFASEFNPGAVEAADELRAYFPNLAVTTTPPHWLGDVLFS